MDRRHVLAGTAGGLLTSLAGCLFELDRFEHQQRSEAKTYAVDDGTELSVDNPDGSITVEGTDEDVVEAEITVHGPSNDDVESVSIAATESDGELRLEPDTDGDVDFDRVTVGWTVTCPPDVAVARLETGSGSIEVRDVSGDPTLDTESGSLTAQNVAGAVSLSTGDGSITARNVDEIERATTEDGSIEADVAAVDGTVEISTEDGSIDAALAPTLDATVTATTEDGSVEVDGLELPEPTDSSVSGTLGDGTHSLSLTTGDGSIELGALSA
ncbi:DUF4097 family beta strand repeat-containing protein [Halopiger djelfimassiliensis]|uniref:DUF4097 family beta strand repeat-containing protein n=1 Tax=Halopiger djelfimassiliensis TaxID=1293047 RepID=UPI000677E669|nr:DUF4097 family beta strand repeat-containing protein [Halopiger djelfimassiliensis]